MHALAAVRWIRVVEQRAAPPMLQNVLLEVAGNSIFLQERTKFQHTASGGFRLTQCCYSNIHFTSLDESFRALASHSRNTYTTVFIHVSTSGASGLHHHTGVGAGLLPRQQDLPRAQLRPSSASLGLQASICKCFFFFSRQKTVDAALKIEANGKKTNRAKTVTQSARKLWTVANTCNSLETTFHQSLVCCGWNSWFLDCNTTHTADQLIGNKTCFQ